MKTKVYTLAYLKSDHWHDRGTYGSAELAIEAARDHFRSGAMKPDDPSRWHAYPDIQYRVYKCADGNGWNPTIVEVGPDDKRPMMALAFYKIMEAYLGSD